MTNVSMENIWKILTENRSIEMNADIGSDIICTACEKVMIKPCNVPCGCRYCLKCLENYLTGKQKLCLGDSDYCKVELINFDKNVFPDQVANMKISRLIVKCPLGSCEFETQLNKLEEHLRTCIKQPVDCPFQTVGCYFVKADTPKMKTHFKEDDISHARLLMQHMCNWENEVRMLKTEVQELRQENRHLQEERNSKSTMETNLDVATPSSQENRSFLEELEAVKLNSKTNQKTIRALDEVLVQLSLENQSLREEVEILKRDNKDVQEMERGMRKKIESQEQESKRLDKKLNENRRLIDMVLGQVKTTSNTQKSKTPMKVHDANVTSSKINRNGGEFMWRIKNWSNKMEQAKAGCNTVLRSSPFYTHEDGYKLCLDIQPNGSGTGVGTHLGLFISVTKGTCDGILNWPFRLDVQLELMNHDTGLAHASKALDYGDAPSSTVMNCPTKACYKNIGFKSFIPLAELVGIPALCRNNQIWIRVISRVPQNNAFCGIGF